MYVMHARNIVRGLPYTQNRYVFQPESTTEIGAKFVSFRIPTAARAILCRIRAQYHVIQVAEFGFPCAFVVASLSVCPENAAAVYSLLLIVALGFSTLFLANFDGFGSDAPYQLVSFLVLLLLLHIYDRRLNETHPWKWDCWLVSVLRGYLIRHSAGAPAAAAGTELLRRRRLTNISCRDRNGVHPADAAE